MCTRIGCAYSHPSGFNPGMGMYPNMMHPVPFIKHKAKHPAGSSVPASKPEVTENKTEAINPQTQNEIVPEQQQQQQPEQPIQPEQQQVQQQ